MRLVKTDQDCIIGIKQNLMNKKLINPQNLIEQFLSGNLSTAKEKELLDWIDLDPKNLSLFTKEQDRLRPVILSLRDKNTNKHWIRLQNIIDIKRTISRQRTKNRLLFIGITTIAASLVVGLFFYALINSKLQNQAEHVAFSSVTTTMGERISLSLPDGTKVNLNAGSILRYPDSFSGNERKVELSGEAFFDVVHNEAKPFIVQTHAFNVRVLGTEFNIEAFPEASEVNTTLVNGKVILEKELGNKMVALAEMKPNERIVYHVDNQKISLSTEKDISQYIAWKDGKLVFLNDPIEEVAKKLGLWYNVSVTIQSEELKKSHFTGTFTNETIEKVLTLLSVSSPIDYKIIQASESSSGKDSTKCQIILTYRQ
jgi:ferric-dicitrate binding protein FerR (iron transport regulator)